MLTIEESAVADIAPCISTGIEGLDNILDGGLTPHRLYLVEGNPGAGKTTLAMQFLLAGAARGEVGLYVTLSETVSELRAVALSHGWDIAPISIFELLNEGGLDPDSEQSILHPSEIELGETTQSVMRRIEELRPTRVTFDSLSEMRLLAQNPLRYRRQILALKHFFATRRCTVLLLDDRTSEPGDLHLHSIAHGVISLEQTVQEFGRERRKLRIVKMRGVQYQGGYHDFNLERGGIRLFPRLIAALHHAEFVSRSNSTGLPHLDRLLGGGLAAGTNILLSGPSGVGKTTTTVRCALAALERGESVAYYLFDEGMATFLHRSKSLAMDLQPHLKSGLLTVHQIDPAEMSPGEFSSMVRCAVEQCGTRFVVIDSLNAYLQAMPGEKFLLLQMHEMLSYLNQLGVLTMLVLGQHGLESRNNIDLSYLSDAIMLFRYFAAAGQIRTAVSIVKSRTMNHERNVRELRLSSSGMEVGDALADFDGMLAGLPSYTGATSMLSAEVATHA
jgi:circadian clock protein KaiC